MKTSEFFRRRKCNKVKVGDYVYFLFITSINKYNLPVEVVLTGKILEIDNFFLVIETIDGKVFPMIQIKNTRKMRKDEVLNLKM